MKISSMKSLMRFLLEKDNLFVYRGQRDASWLLESTINRTAKANKVLLNREHIVEKYIIKHFRESAHLYYKDFDRYNSSDLDIFTLVQHHGAPSRLLDTTFSKYIALFLAFDDVRI